MTMTPEAKSALARTIRGSSGANGGLRQRLLDDFHDATETAYRLGVRVQDAGLDEAQRRRRARFEGWINEQVRAEGKGKKAREAEDFRRDAEKQAAYTWLNRLVMLRLLEETGLSKPLVLSGGWESSGYKTFRALAAALVAGDETEGYAFLLGLIFENLAGELPGLFAGGGIVDLVPMPAATLRHVVEELDKSELGTCWTDDMTLGWVYQYWNDPDREALDAKLNGGGKVEPHEIASKTQMFTERYMVDWLLQNSLGPLWLAMCKKQGWTPGVEQKHMEGQSCLERLEESRVEWRAKRDAGEVELTELMPIESDAAGRWAYYVPQPIPEEAVKAAPDSVRDIRLLDPALGSGHFLLVAFDLLFALYREEAQHRGEEGEAGWSDRACVERILEHNLHGVDLDPRAVQIAAASLWLKAKGVCGSARPTQLNLVASNLKLSRLPDDDAALEELRRQVERETGIPAALTQTIVGALRGADHLGSLLKVDAAVDEAIEEAAGKLGRMKPVQGDLLGGFPERQARLAMAADVAKAALLDRLERFLAGHSRGDDLGLRLRGEQLAAGVRFVRMMREGSYDLVVANPPYQGTAKMVDAKYVEKNYTLGKADLYAAFLLRGLELVREGGVSAMLTMRNWMFIKTYADLRKRLLEKFDLRALGDFDRGAFEEVPDEVVSVAVSAFHRGAAMGASVAICPTPREDRSRDSARTKRKRAATLCHVGRHEFDPAALKVVPEWPLVYWWNEILADFRELPLLGSSASVRSGMQTADNARFVRKSHELNLSGIHLVRHPCSSQARPKCGAWVPYMQGARGQRWQEPCVNVLSWGQHLLGVRVLSEYRVGATIRNEDYFFLPGVAFTPIGSTLTARLHRYSSVCDTMGASVFGSSLQVVLSLMNSSWSNAILAGLNPTIHIQVGDIIRIPLKVIDGAEQVALILDHAFANHESHREPSVEYRCPGSSPWRQAQDWAQLAVDRPDGAPIPEYVEELDPESPTDHLSYALGVALGRFSPEGEGLLDPATSDLAHAIPEGICFLDGSLDEHDHRDSLGHSSTKIIQDKWTEYGPSIATNADLRTWLRLRFFPDVHKGMYENRPIHWPLSSAGKTFVAWVNIHRFTDRTLRVLLADHLHPALTRLDGQLNDLRSAREGDDKRAARNAEKNFDKILKAKNELAEFIEAVTRCADKGPPPTVPNAKTCPPREIDSRYDPDLDDGVMINSAALWPLLAPQWDKPKVWWKELALAKGRKDYDWARLSMRYFPTRVDAKCQKDPSLSVAHGCFWKYHPARAWAWELRLQEEISPDFRIEEPPYRDDGGDPIHRPRYLQEDPVEALAAIEKEALRRRGRGKDSKPIADLTLLEAGLWAIHPADCWALEERIIEKQDAPFRLRAPDEETARAKYEKANPSLAKKRHDLLKKSKQLPLGATS